MTERVLPWRSPILSRETAMLAQPLVEVRLPRQLDVRMPRGHTAIEHRAEPRRLRQNEGSAGERRGIASDELVKARAFRPLMLEPEERGSGRTSVNACEVRNRSGRIVRRECYAVPRADIGDGEHPSESAGVFDVGHQDIVEH